MRPKALLACSNDWGSPFRVGSHHIARALVALGWDVAYVSDPLSPLHLLSPRTYRDTWRRVGTTVRGGCWPIPERLWTYVPLALAVPHDKPILRGHWAHRHWHRGTFPGPARVARQNGFGRVDLLYIDSFTQGFWLDALDYRRSVYRCADRSDTRARYCDATREREAAIVATVDRVVVPSRVLREYTADLGAVDPVFLPNAVDEAAYAEPHPPPPEYAGLPRPLAVYMGVMPEWFGFDFVRAAALRRPDASFVLIGPPDLTRQRLADLPNVRILGVRKPDEVPAFLQHADLGLMPFDAIRFPQVVDTVHPNKLYAYAAAGIPVVSSDWRELRLMPDLPIRTGADPASFAAAVDAAFSAPHCRDTMRAFARRNGWLARTRDLLGLLGLAASPRVSDSTATAA